MLKQTVLSCWNKVFFPIGTLCSALIKQIVLYRRIKLKLVCCRILLHSPFHFSVNFFIFSPPNNQFNKTWN